MHARYEIKAERVGEFDFYKLLDKKKDVVVTVVPSAGGQVIEMSFKGMSILHSPKDAAENKKWLDIMHVSPNDKDFLRKIGIGIGVPLLFPWPNRIKDAKFVFKGKTVRLKPNTEEGFAVHGLVLGKDWKIEEKGVSQEGAYLKVSLHSADFPDILSQFPYSFKITVNWLLQDGALEFMTTVVNEGHETMPMGFGVHTDFRVPMGTASARRLRDDCLISVPAESYWELEHHAIGNGQLIPTGRKLPVNGKKFDLRKPRSLRGLLLDDVLTDLKMEGGWTVCKLYDPAADITVLSLSDENFKHVCLAIPDYGNLIAIEPYTCPTDAFNLEARGIRADVIALEPGDEWSGTIKIVPKSGRLI